MGNDEGKVLAARYRIESLLGEGGLSRVYRATDLSTGEQVAVKVLQDKGLVNLADERFRREMRLQTRIRSDAVVCVREVLTIEGIGLAAVMDLVDGGTLGMRLETRLTFDEVLTVGLRMSSALEAIHAMEVVHGDVKPENIFLPGGSVARAKLSDLGLAEHVDVTGKTLSGTLLGTPLYMSPEAARGESRSRASDIWSLGVVLYECAYGQVPFGASGESLLDILNSILTETPPFPSLPLQFENLLRRILAKKPDERFRSAAELAAELRTYRRGPNEFEGRDYAARLPAEATVARSRHMESMAIAVPATKSSRWGYAIGFVVLGCASFAVGSRSLEPSAMTSIVRVAVPLALGVSVALLSRALITFGERHRVSSQERVQLMANRVHQGQQRGVLSQSIAIAVDSILAGSSEDPRIDLRRASLAFAIDDFKLAKDRGEQRSALERAIEIADKLQEQIMNSRQPWYVQKKESITVVIAVISATTAFLTKVAELRK